MKIKRLLIIVFVVISNSIFAQKFGGGIFSGLTMSQLDGDSWGGYHKAGINLGVYTNTEINEKLSAQLELLYIQKGSKSNSKEPNYIYYKCKLNYIQLPLLVKYKINNKINAEIGIVEAFLRTAYEDDGGGDIVPDIPFRKWETSLLVGALYNINNKLLADVRFGYSIIPVREHPGGQSFLLNKGQFNNVISISLYYKIVGSDKFGE